MEERFRDWSLRFSWKDYPRSNFHGFTIEEDEKTVKRAMRLLMNCQAPPRIHQELKDRQYAYELIAFGHRLVRRRSWRLILEAYTQALMFAPPNSPLLAHCHFYCSVVLYLARFYKEGLFHANRALAVGPVDNLKSKVYICKARCIYEMNGERRCPEVQEAIMNAHIWLGSMNEGDVGRSDVIDSINVLNRARLLQERMETDHDQNEELTIPDDNEKIMQASSAIEIKFNDEDQGRYIAATRDIEAGEILFAHKSYASTIYARMQNEYCWHCSKHILVGVPCNQCPMVLFCDENCRDVAWNEYHDLECLAISAMIEMDMDANEIMSLRLLIKAYKEADCSIDKLRAKLIALQNITDPVEKLYTNGRFDNMKYASIFSLTRRFPVVSTHAARAIIILLCLSATTNIFGEKITDYLGLLQTEGTKFMGCLIMRHIGICYNNAVGELENRSNEICLQMNPLLSLFNHSCDPSVLVHTHRDVKYCIAIKNIARGEQIYRCYLPDNWIMNLPRRRAFLLESFNFNCECNACRNNWRRSFQRDPPSYRFRNYPIAVINQWNLITHNFPSEGDTYSANLPLYSKFFR
ncbi:hypothetical protein PV325_006489 [Microctonus aethiopoides]|nr:hypothetical protein PV325_006489 [Microctonus aethiopoides]